ncbi:iron ABC transporter permease [Lachnoclostridium sp.]|nr:iron ABC transporter permease [Lachnoclostridium sp.]
MIINMNKRKTSFYYLVFTLLLLITIVITASVGSANITIYDSLKVLLSKMPLIRNLMDTSDIPKNYVTIIWNIRIPRILLSGLSGASLALVGACFQGLFRNPLADPQILGISSGAALGATLATLSGVTISFFGLGVIGAFAFIGALLTVLLVYQIAFTGSTGSVTHIVLTGTAISSMLSAMISLLMSIRREQIEKVYMWTLGSFSAASMRKVGFLLLFFIVCATIIIVHARELNIIAAGEETAESLGIDTLKVKRTLIIVGSLLVAACVSVCGIIGFVGLIIPHVIRLLLGPRHERLLPFSCIFGAFFLIVCDTLARTLRAPGEFPVGVITALFGAPYFLLLLYRDKKRMV